MAGKIHVVPYGGAWAVKREGADRASKVTDTKSQAIDIAVRMAYTNEEVIVHNKQGKIVTSYSGNRVRQNRGSSDSGGGCFITTACVDYYGLNDSCDQLTTLRKFRDEFMMNDAQDRNLVKKYYSIAPKLVELLDNHPDKSQIYRKLFRKINEACKYIEQRQPLVAKSIYVEAISSLNSILNTQ